MRLWKWEKISCGADLVLWFALRGVVAQGLEVVGLSLGGVTSGGE